MPQYSTCIICGKTIIYSDAQPLLVKEPICHSCSKEMLLGKWRDYYNEIEMPQMVSARKMDKEGVYLLLDIANALNNTPVPA